MIGARESVESVLRAKLRVRREERAGDPPDGTLLLLSQSFRRLAEGLCAGFGNGSGNGCRLEEVLEGGETTAEDRFATVITLQVWGSPETTTLLLNRWVAETGTWVHTACSILPGLRGAIRVNFEQGMASHESATIRGKSGSAGRISSTEGYRK